MDGETNVRGKRIKETRLNGDRFVKAENLNLLNLNQYEWKLNDINKYIKLFYCQHETTMTAFLCALGLYDGKTTPLSSYISLELYKEQ